MNTAKKQRALKVGDRCVRTDTGELVTVVGWWDVKEFRLPSRVDVVVTLDNGTRTLVKRAHLELV